MWYTVEVNMFDWDSDHYMSYWKELSFNTKDEANAFYDTIVDLKYDGDLVAGRPCKFVHWKEDEDLSMLLGIDHGGIFKVTPRMHHVDKRQVER